MPSGEIVRDRGLEGTRPSDIRPDMIRRSGTVFDYTAKNLQRMLDGKAPIDINGKPTELHHRGQFHNYKVDEYTAAEHRTLPLHEKDRDSEIDRFVFAEERARYWVERARGILNAR